MKLVGLLVAAGLAIGAANAQAGATDPADLAFWAAVQNSTNPAEYKAYLDAFPNGRFAALARVRMTSPPTSAPAADPAAAGTTATPAAPATAAAPTGAPAPAATATPATAGPTGGADLGPVAGGGRVTLTAKPVYQLGEPIKIRFAGLPPGEYHTLRILPADTPNAFQQPIQRHFISTSNRDGRAADSRTGQLDLQTLAPGDYQAVIVSAIFNNANREEIVARAAFKVD